MTSSGTTRAPSSLRSLARVGLAAFVLMLGVTIVGPVANPAPVNAGTADYMEDLLLKWVNDARASRGIPRLKVGWRLEDLAGDRAAEMARAGRIWHPSCLSCLLRKRSVSFSRCGEVIAWTSYPWGYQAARSIFLTWKNSSGHWGILMSRGYTRVGFGVAYRSSGGTTYAAGILVG
jgi:uncharacterized protein YkwD